jgi:hypothetical protein
MVISLGPQRDRPRRHLRGGSRLPASASHLLAADSEIAAGRIALFTPAVTRRSGLCCSRDDGGNVQHNTVIPAAVKSAWTS